MTAKRQPQPTIRDVAAAGVSKSTVSNVVSGAVHVSPKTEGVLEAIARVGYRPNLVARHLVRRRTNMIGVVFGDLGNPFYSELAKLVEQNLARCGYATMICNTDGVPSSERIRIASLLEHRVGGILMLQYSGDPAVLLEAPAGAPLVVVSCWTDLADCVAVDDRAGLALGVEHLAELGHRRIAYASSGLVELQTDAAWLDGCRVGLAAAGIVGRRRARPPLGPAGLPPVGTSRSARGSSSCSGRRRRRDRAGGALARLVDHGRPAAGGVGAARRRAAARSDRGWDRRRAGAGDSRAQARDAALDGAVPAPALVTVVT
jgi:hypothetical protein